MNNTDGSDRDFEAQYVTGNIGWHFNKDAEIRIHLGGYRGDGTDDSSEKDIEKNYQSVSYKLKWNSLNDARLLVRLYRNNDHFEYDWNYPGKGIYRLSTWSGEVQQSMWLGDRHLIVAGFENRQDDADIDEVTNNIDERDTITSGYFQDEFHITKKFHLTTGVRLDYNSNYGNEFSPHIGALMNLSPTSQLYGSFNRAHRAPGLSDRFVKVTYWGRFI